MKKTQTTRKKALSKLPTSVEIGPHKVEIRYVENLTSPEGHGLLGMTDFLSNVIYVSTKCGAQEVGIQAMEHTLYHELSHYVLFYMNKHELNDDETFVDMIGACFYQIASSLK